MSEKQYIIEENERRIRGLKGVIDDYETYTVRGEYSCLASLADSIAREAGALKHNGNLLFKLGGDGVGENK